MSTRGVDTGRGRRERAPHPPGTRRAGRRGGHALDADEVRYEPEGPVLVVTIDRPHVLNALDDAAYASLHAAFDRFEADPALRVAILTGAGGRAFSTGSDMKAGHWLRGAEGATATERGLGFAGTKPVIAAVDGYCLAGGLEWALRCDIRIATRASSFGLPEPRTGTLAGYGLHMLSRMVPAGEAMYMQLTGARIGAERALRCCLVQELVDDAEALMARAREIAAEVVACSPLAVEAVKQIVDFNLRQGVEDSYRYAQPLGREVEGHPDILEGPLAFREKRAPRWSGRAGHAP